MSEQSKIEERRQRAREAFYDATKPGDVVEARAIVDAIETATRVKITDDAVCAMYFAGREGAELTVESVLTKGHLRLAAALAELGFEVES